MKLAKPGEAKMAVPGTAPHYFSVPNHANSPLRLADAIVDFTDVPVGTQIVLQNLGPDEPFGGGEPGVDFVPADPATTGRSPFP